LPDVEVEEGSVPFLAGGVEHVDEAGLAVDPEDVSPVCVVGRRRRTTARASKGSAAADWVSLAPFD
jgi:hypothetical protein